MMRKRLAIVKLGGLAAGGCEKYLQTIAMCMPSEEFEIDYFYSETFPVLASALHAAWIHPGTDPKRMELMRDAKINLIQFSLSAREGGFPGNWHDSNFLELFDERRYDVLLTATNGQPEFPFNQLCNVKQVETVHGSTFDTGPSSQAHKFIFLAQWQRERWVAKGGPIERSIIIPSLVQTPPRVESNLRKRLGISSDAVVMGMHQATRDDIFSPIPLEGFAWLQQKMDCHYVLLGGSDKYKRQAEELKLTQIHFIPFDSDPCLISQVLGSLDIYAHGRFDGEVCSACIIEALYHQLPIVSVFGINNGHVEQIGEAGTVVSNKEDYGKALYILATDRELRQHCASAAAQRFQDVYRFELNRDKIIDIIREVAN